MQPIWGEEKPMQNKRITIESSLWKDKVELFLENVCQPISEWCDSLGEWVK